jgi:dTDP-4-dehydrorhamnose reductase
MKPTRVAVTGSEGYIGSALCAALRMDSRVEVSGWDLKPKTAGSLAWNHDQGSPSAWDIRNREHRMELWDWKPDVVVNLAGSSGEKQCEEDPYWTALTNADAVKHLAMEASRRGVWIFQASSMSIHSEGEYATQKRVGERYMLDYCKGQKALIMRFGTVFGLSPKMRWDLPLHKMIETYIQTGRVNVYGPRQMRPMLWIEHLVQFLVDAVTQLPERFDDGVNGLPLPAVSLASFNASVLELAQLVTPNKKDAVQHLEAPAKPRSYVVAPVFSLADGQVQDIVKTIFYRWRQDHGSRSSV